MTKVKKWDSFKNAFVVTRHRSASPQRSSPLPTDSLPADNRPRDTRHAAPAVEVNRNKSFLDKFRRVKRDRSNSPAEALRDEEKAPRPLSEDVNYSQTQQKLTAALVDPPMAVSVPNSPLARKRTENGVAREERASLSPVPHSSQTPAGSSAATSPVSTPEHKPEREPATPSPPKLTSTPAAVQKDKPSPPPRVSSATPRPPVSDNSKLSPRHYSKKKLPSPPSPLASEENPLPEVLTKPLVWEEVKATLDSLEDKEPLFSDTLPPRDEPWMEKETPIEQLREFLAICP
jgi:hypothetical protein